MFLDEPFNEFLGRPVRNLLPCANFDFATYVPNVIGLTADDWKEDVFPYIAAGHVDSL